jgi:hypothetical protein
VFQVQVLPARIAGGEGRYALDSINITGFEVEDARISTEGTRGSFVFTNFAGPRLPGKGRILRTNLVRRRAGWSWLTWEEDVCTRYTCAATSPPDVLVTVEYGGMHFYAVSVEFERLRLEHYPEAPSEPRLRPTCRAREIVLGEQVGTIRMRGRERPVYGAIRVLAA